MRSFAVNRSSRVTFFLNDAIVLERYMMKTKDNNVTVVNI